jgi:peptidoglycan/xylan/chitin deacetylase (PgdA/CDA1 family)
LTYHSLDDSGSVISITPSLFARQMDALAASKIPVVPLDEVTRRPGSIAITFDDGFANFHEHALPILTRHAFPATVFVVTGHCGGYNDWDSGGIFIPKLPLMTWDQLHEISKTSVTLGAHSVTHPHLDRIPTETAWTEIIESAEAIQHQTGEPVKHFAYPYGESTDPLRRRMQTSFATACGTRLGLLEQVANLADLPRIDAYYMQGAFQPTSLFTPSGRLHITLRAALRQARRRTLGY